MSAEQLGMKMKKNAVSILVGLLTAGSAVPALAQSHSGHGIAKPPAVDAAPTGKMQCMAQGDMQQCMAHCKAQGMDSSKMKCIAPGTKPGMGQGDMKGMDHSKMQGMGQGHVQGMDHSKMQGSGQGDMPGMDHSKMQGMDQGGMQGMDHSKMQGMDQGGMQGMDHGAGGMKMQGGSAPPDARDPNAYADGFVNGTGLYAIGPNRSLHMADEHSFATVLVDRLEAVDTNSGRSTSYEAQAWFGNSYNKLVIKTEGEVAQGRVHEARNELLWGRAISTYFDTQLGIRNDAGSGRPSRTWLAFGVQGISPYWFEVEATGYVSQNGRAAARFAAEYELLLTQRLILQPRVEANIYSKNDPDAEIGSGLANASTGLRLRYEFSRQFAPYIGVEKYSTFGKTADLVRASGGRASETRVVAGVRMWF